MLYINDVQVDTESKSTLLVCVNRIPNKRKYSKNTIYPLK